MILEHLPKRSEFKKISKTFQIDVRMYEKLVYLSKRIYDADVTEIVSCALEYLVAHPSCIQFYQTDYMVNYHTRTYNIRPALMKAMDDISARYSNLSYTMLVNIAVHNLLEEEAENLREYDNQ